MDENDTRSDITDSIRRWESRVASTPSVRVEIYRLQPEHWRGEQIAGKVGHYDELPELEDIRSDYGGGKYRLILKRPDDRGRLVYSGCVTVAIAGPPIGR